jgi:signal peptidase II
LSTLRRPTLRVLPETESQQSTAGRREVSVVAVFAYTLDRISKILVVENLTLGQPVDVVGELLQFRYVENPGAAFSLGSGSTWIFAIIAAVVAVFIIAFARRIRSTGWAVLFGMLLGGNLGNLTDRLIRPPGFGIGHVVDFIQVYAFPAIFNVADIAIVSSMGLFILLTLRGVGLDGKRASKKEQLPAPGAPSSPDPASAVDQD